MSNITPPNLGIIITNARIRKIIYGLYIIALLVAGGIQVYFSAVQLGQPVWIVGALAVLAYLGIPVGTLALSNSPASGAVAVLPAIVSDPVAPAVVGE